MPLQRHLSGHDVRFMTVFLLNGHTNPLKFRNATGSFTHHEVCACKQDVEAVEVFRQTAIAHLGISKQSLHNKERMLHLAPGG